MITGTTASGFEFSVDEGISNDMELLDALADLDEGDGLALSRISRLILGTDQRKRLYEYLRKDGRVPTTAVEAELMDIISQFNSGKK